MIIRSTDYCSLNKVYLGALHLVACVGSNTTNSTVRCTFGLIRKIRFLQRFSYADFQFATTLWLCSRCSAPIYW